MKCEVIYLLKSDIVDAIMCQKKNNKMSLYTVLLIKPG